MQEGILAGAFPCSGEHSDRGTAPEQPVRPRLLPKFSRSQMLPPVVQLLNLTTPRAICPSNLSLHHVQSIGEVCTLLHKCAVSWCTTLLFYPSESRIQVVIMFACPRPFFNTTKRVESASLVSHGQTTTGHAAASLSSQREPSRIHPPKKYLAVYAQVVLAGPAADVPMVARVSLTDYRGQVLLDTFVRPSQPVTGYRHAITGLKPEHLMNAPQFSTIQRQIASMIHGKIIVGYMLWHFLSVLGIPHPAFDTRDVAVFAPFRRSLKCRQILPLSVLINRLMGRNIGYGYEHPLENARASLDLFRSCEQVWEDVIQSGSWPCLLPPVAYANFFS